MDLRVRQAVAGLQARRSSGERVVVITLEARGSEGRGRLEVVDDFERMRAAIAALVRRTVTGPEDALGPQPFRRVAILRALSTALDGSSIEWCCEVADGMPEAALDLHPPDDTGGTVVGSPPRYQAFLRYCGRCHDTADPFPPNFLHGSPPEIEAKLTQCAERIYFRLGMWSQDAALRPKTPMPPENALQALAVSREEWRDHADLRALRGHAASLLQSQGRPARLEALEARGYSNLKTCLPDASTRTIEGSP